MNSTKFEWQNTSKKKRKLSTHQEERETQSLTAENDEV